MSTAVLSPPAAETTVISTWETITNGLSDATNWVVRNVKWLGSAIADSAVKVYEWAKPAFISIGKFFAEQYESLREFLSQHKEASIAVAVASTVTLIVAGLSYLICCAEEKPLA